MGFPADMPLISICASARWESKRWPITRFTQLAEQLYTHCGAGLIFVGSKSDTPAVREITAEKTYPYLDATGKTSLRQLAELTSRTRLMVTNDTGPMHIAAGTGVPTVALFGPTDPERTGSYGANHTVLQGNCTTITCGKRFCQKNHACMETISVPLVLESVKKVLNVCLQ